MKNLSIISDDLTGAVDSSSFSMASGSRVRVEITYENDILSHNKRRWKVHLIPSAFTWKGWRESVGSDSACIAECVEKICASIDFDRIVDIGGETSFAILHGLKNHKTLSD